MIEIISLIFSTRKLFFSIFNNKIAHLRLLLVDVKLKNELKPMNYIHFWIMRVMESDMYRCWTLTHIITLNYVIFQNY